MAEWTDVVKTPEPKPKKTRKVKKKTANVASPIQAAQVVVPPPPPVPVVPAATVPPPPATLPVPVYTVETLPPSELAKKLAASMGVALAALKAAQNVQNLGPAAQLFLALGEAFFTRTPDNKNALRVELRKKLKELRTRRKSTSNVIEIQNINVALDALLDTYLDLD